MSFNNSQSPPPGQGQGQGQPQRSYSPYQNNGSNAGSPYPAAASPPGQGGFAAPPPAKRQRLSPDARSTQPASPMNAQSSMNGNAYMYHQQPQQQHPSSSYGNPYAQQHQQQHTIQRPYSNSPFPPPPEPQHSFNTPDPHPQHQNRFGHNADTWQNQQRNVTFSRHQSPQGGMPPPPRPPPKEDRNEDFNDVLAGSGINLKDEEALMYESNNSFSSRYDTSFGSSSTNITNGFTELMQSMHGQPGAWNGAMQGTMGEPRSQEEIDSEMEQLRAKAAADRARMEEHHMKRPFLQGRVLRQRLDAIAFNNGVTVNTQGLFEKKKPQIDGVQMMNETGNQGVSAVKDEVVQQGAPIEQILALLSLATGDRVRGLMDDSHMYARARRYGDRGRVPPDFADLATGEGSRIDDMVVPENITGTQWDRVPDGAPRDEDGNLQPMKTHRYENAIHKVLNDQIKADAAAEEVRLAKRAARKRAAEAKQNGNGTADSASTPADADTPSASADTTNHSKITKKERERQKKESQEQASGIHAAAHTNAAAVAAVMGKKTKKYSWMTQGEDKTSNRFAKTAANRDAKEIGAAGRMKAEPTTPGGVGGTPAPEAKKKTKVWGGFSERGPEGRGIQMRDWILALEKDGKDKRALSYAYDNRG